MAFLAATARTPSLARGLLLGLGLLAALPGCTPPRHNPPPPEDAGNPPVTGPVCLDNDGDGVGGTGSCSADCDDSDATTYPGAPELCDGQDNDCNGLNDDGLAVNDYFLDADGDSFGSTTLTGRGCRPPTTDSVLDSSDCDDTELAIHPGATEVCNVVDDNCNTQIDEGLPTSDYYPDLDGDGFGSKNANPQASCRPVDGKVTDHTDCNDTDATIRPGGMEFCNSIDDNCDGLVDNEVVTQNYYPDLDGDGYGAAGSVAQASCNKVAGKVTNNTDCNDQNANIHPGAQEVCDDLDNNCNGQKDEGLPLVGYYLDGDSDSFGAINGTPVSACRAPTGRVANHTDCNDANALINPTAPERCNNLDDNCNGVSDEGNPGGGATCNSGQPGVCAAGIVTCQVGQLNCVATTAPSAETCDNLDNNCEGRVDETFTNKGQSCSVGTGACQNFGTMVCNTAGNGTVCNAVIGSLGPPACDGIDNDCNGIADERLLVGTAQVHASTWQDVEVIPYYYSTGTGNCNGGTTGSGTDALIGGAMVVAGPNAAGIRYVRLDTSGVASSTGAAYSTPIYSDSAIAQTWDGFLLAGVTNNATYGPVIDVFNVSVGAYNRSNMLNQLKAATGNTIDSLRAVRGNGARVTLVWRESGTNTASAGIKLAQVEEYYNGSAWTMRDARTLGTTLSPVTLVSGATAPGLGADSTVWDWDVVQTCQAVATKRTIAVAYLATAQSLRLFTVAEDGTGKSAETVVQTETGSRSLLEPEVAFFRSGSADQWFVAYVTSDSAAASAELDYWLTTSPSKHAAYQQSANADGANSIARPRASVTANRVWLTALRSVSDPSGFKRQVMFRQIDFAGAKDPTSTSVELPVTTGSCTASQTDCRPGDKISATSWAGIGKVFFSTSGSTVPATYATGLTCN